jgi:hypothetical protein
MNSCSHHVPHTAAAVAVLTSLHQDAADQQSSLKALVLVSYLLLTALLVIMCAGDIVGHSVAEKIVAMIAMLIGASVFG